MGQVYQTICHSQQERLLLRNRFVVVIAIAAFGVFLVTLAQAQQSMVQLDEGDEVAVTCPTQLSVDFDQDGTATVTCAPYPDDTPTEESV